VLNANLGIAERNQQAKALADAANLSARSKELAIFGDPEANDFSAALRELTPDQQALLELGTVNGKQAFIPRLMQPVPAPQQSQVDPSVLFRILGMEAPTNLQAPPPLTSPAPARPSQVIPISAITRSGGTNTPPAWNQRNQIDPLTILQFLQQRTNTVPAGPAIF
jgi:hypothetical protein